MRLIDAIPFLFPDLPVKCVTHANSPHEHEIFFKYEGENIVGVLVTDQPQNFEDREGFMKPDTITGLKDKRVVDGKLVARQVKA